MSYILMPMKSRRLTHSGQLPCMTVMAFKYQTSLTDMHLVRGTLFTITLMVHWISISKPTRLARKR